MVDMILDTRRPKGHRQVDGHLRARPGHPADADRRGGLRPLPVGAEGRARGGVRRAARPDGQLASADKAAFVDDLRGALYASKIVSYTQGYMLMRAAAAGYGWNLNYGGIALMWRGGCIIRSVFLGKIKEAFDADPNLTNLLLTPTSRKQVTGGAGRLAARGRQSGRAGHPGAGHVQRAGLLRRLSPRLAAGQPAAGPARLLRRAHLRARRQAARPVLPHQLDRRGRRCDGQDV